MFARAARLDRRFQMARSISAAIVLALMLTPHAATAEVAASAEQADSPWEHDLWHGATTMMRIYVCSHARRPPSWCAEEQQLPSEAPLPDEQGPPLTAEDAAWMTFLETADPGNLSLKDVAFIKKRALKRRDTQAMEILGYLYAQGISVDRDYAEAYRWYGRAYLAGEKRVKPNMDLVWGLLQKFDLQAAVALTREFNALEEASSGSKASGEGTEPSTSTQSSSPAVQDPTGP